MKNNSGGLFEQRITGTFPIRFWIELFSNSAYFPVANILFELLIESPLDYLRAPDLYVLVFSALIQAYVLTRWQVTEQPRRLIGNLVGPAVYTLVESSLEGPRFFAAYHHLGYWGFALAIGLLQELRFRFPNMGSLLIVVENAVRTAILFFMYAIFETYANPSQTLSLQVFFSDESHVFIGLAILVVGLSTGLANLMAEHYLRQLRQTSSQLHMYSEWLLGRDLLLKTLENPKALHTARRERTVLFMDIRGFTAWSEMHTPEEVVALLDAYYRASEAVLTMYPPVKFKFSADEVMAIFSDADVALHAAMELRRQITPLLAKEKLGAGIGLESGLVVEGLLGGTGVKFYDAIGDTVNTAKRIESAAEAGEVLVSGHLCPRMQPSFKIGATREIHVKGKKQAVVVCALEDESAHA